MITFRVPLDSDPYQLNQNSEQRRPSQYTLLSSRCGSVDDSSYKPFNQTSSTQTLVHMKIVRRAHTAQARAPPTKILVQ